MVDKEDKKISFKRKHKVVSNTIDGKKIDTKEVEKAGKETKVKKATKKGILHEYDIAEQRLNEIVARREASGDRKVLTPSQWSSAAALYGTGKYTLPEIAEAYGVSVSAVSFNFREKGVKQGEIIESVEKEIKQLVLEKSLIPLEEAAAIHLQNSKQAIQIDKMVMGAAVRDAAKVQSGEMSIQVATARINYYQKLQQMNTASVKTVKDVTMMDRIIQQLEKVEEKAEDVQEEFAEFTVISMSSEEEDILRRQNTNADVIDITESDNFLTHPNN